MERHLNYASKYEQMARPVCATVARLPPTALLNPKLETQNSKELYPRNT